MQKRGNDHRFRCTCLLGKVRALQTMLELGDRLAKVVALGARCIQALDLIDDGG